MCRAIVLSILLCAACAPESAPPPPLAREPLVDDRSAAQSVVADLDCDTRPDSAVMLRSDTLLTLVVFRAAQVAPHRLEIPVSSDRQFAVCTAGAHLSAEPLDYVPGSDGIPLLEGFQSSATCRGLALADDRCDALHLYWNGTAQRFSEWRR